MSGSVWWAWTWGLIRGCGVKIKKPVWWCTTPSITSQPLVVVIGTLCTPPPLGPHVLLSRPPHTTKLKASPVWGESVCSRSRTYREQWLYTLITPTNFTILNKTNTNWLFSGIIIIMEVFHQRWNQCVRGLETLTHHTHTHTLHSLWIVCQATLKVWVCVWQNIKTEVPLCVVWLLRCTLEEHFNTSPAKCDPWRLECHQEHTPTVPGVRVPRARQTQTQVKFFFFSWRLCAKTMNWKMKRK